MDARDNLTLPQSSQRMAAALQAGRLVCFPGAGRGPHYQHPLQAAAVGVPFLRGSDVAQ